MILEAAKLCRSYVQGSSTISVLNNLNLRINEPETIAIIGQSGSGKSTLLSLLAGLDRPDTGSIVLHGQSLTEMSERALSEFRARHLSIVFQQFHLLSNLTALENVSLPLEIRHQSDAKQAAQAALEKVGLAARKDHFPSQLSGGECQRVAIARALVTNPMLLLADEPSGNLDTKTGKQVMDLLFNLARDEKTTLILVTHNEDLAQKCQRVLVLENGRLRERES